MKTFHFMRMTEDGRLTTQVGPRFESVEDAKAAAPKLLVGLRAVCRVFLVETIHEAKVLARVGYSKP